MYRALTLSIFLVIVICLPAYAQDFKVLAVSENFKQVILYEKGTGREYTAQAGDEVDGWRIVEINQEYVTISKPQNGYMLSTRIPLTDKYRIIREQP